MSSRDCSGKPTAARACAGERGLATESPAAAQEKNIICQYVLKDHLGNTRITATTKPDVTTETATLETANLATEQGQFLRIDNARRVQAILFDRTNGAANGYAQRLNGSTNEKYGIAKSLQVNAGDTIRAEVYAKYVDPNSANWTGALNTLIGQIAANTAGVLVDGVNYTTSTSTFPYAGLNGTSGSSGSGPKAYLNWLVFDKNFAFKTGGFMRMTTAAREYGQDVAHERLFSPTIAVAEAGYVYIYVSNEETAPLEVYFDDMKITYTKSPVVQADDYYAFGLSVSDLSFRKQSSIENRYLFNQGAGDKKFLTERITELGINVDMTKYRVYDPAVGRWWQVDPKSDKADQECVSPYNYSYNNPARYDDPEGDCPLCAVVGAVIGAAVGGGVEIASQLIQNGEVTDWGAVGGASIQGGITGGVAGLTGGSSLLVTSTASVAANVTGGALSNVVQGKEVTVQSVTKDAIAGAAGPLAGKVVASGVNKLPNGIKGKIGEVATEAKYLAKGYVSKGKAIVATGQKTPTGKIQVAKYDHNMKQILTGKKLTVESKFNSSSLTANQRAAADKVTTPGGLKVDYTTGDQIGNVAGGVASGTASSQINNN